MSEVCQNCEGYYDTVFRVPTGVWEKLTGHADGGGLLCPACCDLLARRAGLELYWEATVGKYPVAAERERCARMLEARARVMLEAWGDYMYGHSNAKHRADSARAETLCEAAAAIRAGTPEE